MVKSTRSKVSLSAILNLIGGKKVPQGSQKSDPNIAQFFYAYHLVYVIERSAPVIEKILEERNPSS